MKKLVSLLLAVLMIFSLAACGGKTEDAGTTTEESGKYVIANTPKCVGIAWWDRMEVGNKRWSESTGHEVYQTGADSGADASAQLQYIEDAIAEGVDIITLIAADTNACEQVAKKARDAGIVVIAHECSNMKNVDYDIEAFNNAEYGAHLMDLIAEECGGEGEYCVVVGGFAQESHREWERGADARAAEAYPNMVKLDTIEGPTSEDARTKVKEVIAAHPNVKAFIGCDMCDPTGIADAVADAGKTGEIAVTGTCLTSVCGDYVKSGAIKTFCAWDPAIAGEAMCSLGVMVKEGVEIKDGMDLGVEGFHNIKLVGNVVYGQAWFDGTIDTIADYDF